jgi:Ca2+-binding EF-hand superfamily protein
LDDLFKVMDADGDGSVSKSELAAFMEKAGPPQGPPTGAPPAGGPPPGMPPDMGSADATTSSSATSTTGSTSKTTSSTDPMDANGDGTVTAEERMAFAYQQLMAALQRLGEAAGDNGSTSTTSVTS